MDDVDAVQGQIARNMLTSGDWVTARLDGVAYLEKAPLVYWAMAIAYKIFGVHDWAARVPIVLAAIGLAGSLRSSAVGRSGSARDFMPACAWLRASACFFYQDIDPGCDSHADHDAGDVVFSARDR